MLHIFFCQRLRIDGLGQFFFLKKKYLKGEILDLRVDFLKNVNESDNNEADRVAIDFW